MLEIFINVFGPAIALGINSGVLRAGREPDDDEIEPLSRALLERARATPSIGYLAAIAQLQALARGLVAFFADYDVLVTPALAERPLAIGECNGLGERSARATSTRSGCFTPYTSLFNITGQPAISLPVGFGADGLPTGVQIVGKPLNEDTLLQLAAQIETAHPWAHHRPSELAVPSHRARGLTPSASAPAVPRALSISTASSCASSQVTSAVGPASVSSARSAARRPASGSGSARRRRPGGGEHEPHDLALGERLRARRARGARGRSAAGGRARRSRSRPRPRPRSAACGRSRARPAAPPAGSRAARASSRWRSPGE